MNTFFTRHLVSSQHTKISKFYWPFMLPRHQTSKNELRQQYLPCQSQLSHHMNIKQSCISKESCWIQCLDSMVMPFLLPYFHFIHIMYVLINLHYTICIICICNCCHITLVTRNCLYCCQGYLSYHSYNLVAYEKTDHTQTHGQKRIIIEGCGAKDHGTC